MMPTVLKSIRKAYKGGWRAGLAPKKLITLPNGTKTLEMPVCPYTGRYQVIQRLAWEQGNYNGVMQSFTNFKKKARRHG